MDLQVGVKVVLRRSDGLILVLKRSEKYGASAGKWDIPGGRIEAGTSLMENLAREVQEETGLALRSTPHLIAAQDIMLDDAHVVRLTYVGHADRDPVLSGEEHTEFQWMALTELHDEPLFDRYVNQLLEEGLLTEESWQ